MSIDGSFATVSGTTLSFVAAAVASGRAMGANAAAVVARAANTAAFIFCLRGEMRVTRPYVPCVSAKISSPALHAAASACASERLRVRAAAAGMTDQVGRAHLGKQVAAVA